MKAQLSEKFVTEQYLREQSFSTIKDQLKNNVYNLQHYFPLYDHFITDTSANENIALNHTYHIVDLQHSYHRSNSKEVVETPIFIKYSPLLDPLRYMVGKYNKHNDLRTLPSTVNNEPVHPKLLDCNNASYVDGFFCFLTNQMKHHHGFVHGLDYYGSLLGIQHKFKIDVEDDLDYLTDSEFFNDHLGKLFTVENVCIEKFVSNSTRSKRDKLVIKGSTLKCNITYNNLESLSSDNDTALAPLELVTDISPPELEINEELHNSDDDSDNSSICNTSDSEMEELSELEQCEEDEEESSDDSDGEDSSPVYAYIDDFPVQLIFMEKCTNTLDHLFEHNNVTDESGSAWLFQIIMILVTYQQCFSFTHNDLHTNNVMFVDTTIPYLYYTYKQQTYKVPTFGKLFKLIDFGRSIYKYNGRTYCSDSFAPSGDAHTQYNCEPYMDDTKPRLDPNPSFDLCRLSCSIYDFIMDEDCKNCKELQTTIQRWIGDDFKKNILYKKNGEERYPQFKLYKMIARTVHNHVPGLQLDYPFFKQYVSKETVDKELVMNIDSYPIYVDSQ